jgi:hypothetical protein
MKTTFSHFIEYIKRFFILYKWLIIGYPVWVFLFWNFFHHNTIVTDLAFTIYVTIFYFLIIRLFKKIFSSILTDKFNIYLISSSILATIIALSPVIFKGGWPLNHDQLLWKIHTETYVAHICKFDLIPIWSSRDGAGMGVPTPLYYHKLFYYISSFYYMIFAKMKVSILFTIASFMFIGISGIYKTSVYIGNNKWVSLFISSTFVLLNYSMSNWFLRGAMAEFSAMMIVPFLILEELKLLKTKKYSVSLAIIIFLIYFSHSIIGFYSLFTVLFTLLILSFNISKSEALKIFKKLGISALIILAILLIYIVPMYIFSDYFNPSQIKENNLIPKYKFEEFIRYLYDYKYEWFSEPYWGFSVQFDLPVLILIIASLSLFIFKIKEIKITTFKRQVLFLILIMDLFFILLQLKISNIFYENIPGADFIQFPWRLLTFIQTLNLLILSWLLSYINIKPFKKIPYIFACTLLLTIIICYPPFKGTKYWWYQGNDLEQISHESCNAGEYLPSIYGDNFQKLLEHLYLFKKRGIEIKEKDNYLNITNSAKLENETSKVELEANFKNISEVIIPITYSSLTRMYRIDPKTNNKQQIPIYRTDSDPRIRAILPFGVYHLQIDLPTLKNIFIPKKMPNHREKFKTIECDAESLSEYGTFLVSKCGLHFFANPELRSNEISRSGKYSIKLIGNSSYGFTYVMNSQKDYSDEWELSVWRHGSNKGTLLIQTGDSILFGQNKSIEVDSAGWELLKIRFNIPPQLADDIEIKYYVFNACEINPIYFDDFKLEIIEKRNDELPTYKNKMAENK